MWNCLGRLFWPCSKHLRIRFPAHYSPWGSQSPPASWHASPKTVATASCVEHQTHVSCCSPRCPASGMTWPLLDEQVRHFRPTKYSILSNKNYEDSLALEQKGAFYKNIIYDKGSNTKLGKGSDVWYWKRWVMIWEKKSFRLPSQTIH